ncbi:hypothetical protein MKW94_029858 [Papaver nudicaule]|uniref:RING-type E3 ubiquitin transferase n=1 Tax=Papaver nudicaule TaxID=74823 RepID=A0AA42AX83_PAPNU|nr:hypothetical protein [Papaver nudicaule]
MKFVHPKCLLYWMKQQITFECEVCKHKFSVHRVYAENTPTRLPLREFVGGIAMKACHVLHFCLRFCFSVFHQLFMVPLLGFWTWRLSFVRGFSEAHELVHGHMSPSTVMMDWLYGLVVGNAVYMIVFFGLDFIRDDEVHVEIDLAPGNENVNPNADEIVEDTAEPEDIVGVGAPAPGNENENPNADEIVEDTGGEAQAVAGVGNDDNAAVGLTLLVLLLQFIFTLVLRLMSTIFRLHVPVRMTCGYLVMCTVYFLLSNGVLIFVPFSLGRITMHCLSWFFSATWSIFMLFIQSAPYVGNNLLKNVSHAVTNVSAGIQNDGLLSCAIEVVAENLTANSTGPGEALGSDGKPLLVDRSSGLYDVITLATGYMVVPLVFICLGIPIRTVVFKIHYYLRKFLTRMIYPLLLIFHLGVLPLVYGWWLDVCTVMMLGKLISDRVDFFSKVPLLSSSMHWTAGTIYMFLIHISTSHFRKVLREEVVYLLKDLADPVHIILCVLYDEVQVQASRLLFSIVVNGMLIVFLVYLPVALAMRLAPSIFPLHISASDPFSEIPVVMLLIQICLPCATELQKTLEGLVYQWVTAVCYGGQDNVKVERRQDRLHDVYVYSSELYRVVLLVVLAWITFLFFSSSLIIVSLPLGRVLFSSISNLSILHGIKCNDLYAFFIGQFSIWTSFTGVRFFIEHLKAGTTHLRFNDICKLFCIIVESCILFSLWIIVIPVLIGLLFELSFMVPIRALVIEAPVLHLCQDWAAGSFFFKLWRTLVLRNHMIVLVDESWRIKFERVRDNDFLKLPGHWMLQEILIPILMNLLMSLSFPYVFARWIVPSLGFPQTVNSTVYSFTWVAYMTILVLISCAKRFPVWITNLHSSIRDDHYSGLELQNFGEAVMECENEIGKLVRWLLQSQGR